MRHDEWYDPLFQKMVEAFRGQAAAWLRVNEALRDAMVAYARERSPYYRAHIPPGTPFGSVPILTKDLVREHGEGLLAEDVPHDRRVKLQTSGSTGDPLTFYRDTAQGPAEHTSGERFLRWLQGIPREATMVFVSTRARRIFRPDDRDGRGRSLRRPPVAVHPVTARDFSGPVMAREARRWARLSPYFLYGRASGLLAIAEQVERGRASPRPVAVVTTGEMVSDDAVDRLGRAFECPVHQWYGSNELSGYLAAKLPGRGAFVFNPFLCHVEVLDDDARPVEPGGTGRLVITDLNNHVMPFLRYDTGDVATRAAEPTIGGCQVVERIEGRRVELIRLPTGRVISGILLGSALFHAGGLAPYVRRWQCVHTSPASLEIRVVWTGGEPDEEVLRRGEDAVRDLAGPGIDVRIRGVDALEQLPSGKTSLVRREF